MIVKLKEIAEVKAGNSAPQKDSFTSSGIPFVRAGSLEFLVRNQSIDECEKVGEIEAKKSNLKLFPKGSVLFAKSGMSAKMGRVYQLPIDAFVVSHLAVLIPNEKIVSSGFLKYYFIGNPPFNLIRDDAYPSIKLSDIENVEIDLPVLETQNKIVAILDKVNELVQKRQQTIDLLDELLRARFFEILGDLEKFDRVPFKSVLSKPLRNGISPSSNGTIEHDVLILSAITAGKFDNSKIKRGMFQQKPDDDKIVNSSDFLVCRGNGNLDMVGVGEFAEDINHAVFPDTIIAATIDTNKIRKLFLTFLWKTQFIRNQIKKASRTTNGTHKINQTGLENVELILPSISLQDQFEQLGESVNWLIGGGNNLSTSKADLDALLGSLTQRAFSGKLKFDISVQLNSLLEVIDLQRQENDLISIITNEEYLLSLVNRLNNQEFETQDLYNKAKHAAIQLLKNEERLAQEYDENSKSLKLIVK